MTKEVVFDTDGTAGLLMVRDGIITDPERVSEILAHGQVLRDNAREYIDYLQRGQTNFEKLLCAASKAARQANEDESRTYRFLPENTLAPYTSEEYGNSVPQSEIERMRRRDELEYGDQRYPAERADNCPRCEGQLSCCPSCGNQLISCACEARAPQRLADEQ